MKQWHKPAPGATGPETARAPGPDTEENPRDSMKSASKCAKSALSRRCAPPRVFPLCGQIITMSDERGAMVQPGGTAPETTRNHWIPLGAATAVAVLLVAVWSLLDTLLPGAQRINAGDVVTLGQGGGYRAALTLPQDGWNLDVGASQAGQVYRFHRGTVDLTVTSVTPVGDPLPDAKQLWEGMGDIARAGDPTARLGEPEAITTEQGVEGLTGVMRSRTEEGAAVLYPSPDGGFAVEMTLGGADATTADLEAVADVARAVTFTEEGGR